MPISGSYFAIVFLALFVVLTSFAINAGLVFRFLWTRGRLRRLAARGGLSLFALAYLLLILEGFVFLACVASDSNGHSLMSRRWFHKYWGPVNSLGYRDDEHSPGTAQGRRRLFIVGDSFVAGHGIVDRRQRFSDLIAGQLQDEWEVVLVAQCGFDTRQEYAALESHPLSPDAVVLSYFINDIGPVATEMGINLDTRWLNAPPPPAFKPLVEHSYLANYVYWRAMALRTREKVRDYHQRQRDAYFHSEIWGQHAADLQRFVDYCRQRDIPLLVVVFPHLAAIEQSQPVTEQVAGWFTAQQVPVLNVSKLVSGRDPSELVVNHLDAHPNERLHRLVAQHLLEYIGRWRPPTALERQHPPESELPAELSVPRE